MRYKGQVKRIITPDGVVWKAELSQEAAGHSLLKNVLDRVFEGSARRLVLHLLEHETLSEQDRQEIHQLLAAQKKK